MYASVRSEGAIIRAGIGRRGLTSQVSSPKLGLVDWIVDQARMSLGTWETFSAARARRTFPTPSEILGDEEICDPERR